MSVNRLSLGRWGEERAARFFEERGARVVGRNIRLGRAEIDLLVCEADEYVFVEVKTRRNDRFGHPECAITRTKVLRMIRSAQLYLKIRHLPAHTKWRLDVVAITKTADNEQIHHLRSIDAPEGNMLL